MLERFSTFSINSIRPSFPANLRYGVPLSRTEFTGTRFLVSVDLQSYLPSLEANRSIVVSRVAPGGSVRWSGEIEQVAKRESRS
jgi:hypothetical protein